MTQVHKTPATTTGQQHLLATFPTYVGAEKLVDTLSDKGFPVEHVRIVGNDLRSVEKVTGRLTPLRAAGAGAASGAWVGLFIGLILGVFSNNNLFGLLVSSAVMGAIWFAGFGFFAQWATRGHRDFASTKSFEAASYDVLVDEPFADQAISAAGLL